MIKLFGMSLAVLTLAGVTILYLLNKNTETYSWKQSDLEKLVSVESNNYIYSIPIKYLDSIGRNPIEQGRIFIVQRIWEKNKNNDESFSAY